MAHWQEFASIVAKYPDDASLQYIWKENPSQMELDYWQKHFELEFFKTWAPRGSAVFDFGCGCGGLDMQLALVGYTVRGYDSSAGSIEIARAQAASHRIKVDFYSTRLEPFSIYDVAWMCHTLEHIPTDDFESVFKTFAPKPLLITVPLAHGYDSPFHVQHWDTEEQLAKAIEPYVHINWVRLNTERSVIRAEVVPYDVLRTC